MIVTFVKAHDVLPGHEGETIKSNTYLKPERLAKKLDLLLFGGKTHL